MTLYRKGDIVTVECTVTANQLSSTSHVYLDIGYSVSADPDRVTMKTPKFETGQSALFMAGGPITGDRRVEIIAQHGDKCWVKFPAGNLDTVETKFLRRVEDVDSENVYPVEPPPSPPAAEATTS